MPFDRIKRKAKRLTRTPFGKSGRQDIFEPVPFEVPEDKQPDPLQALIDRLGDEGQARRIFKLQQQFPQGTLPELLTYDWLTKHQVRFLYQLALYGGRRQHGGLVPDFALLKDATVTVWQVQGNYWHDQPGTREADISARLKLLGTVWEGRRIDQVIYLWESAIMRDVDHTCSMALAGMETGK